MESFTKGRSGLYLPTIRKVEIGIDDTGLLQANLYGWAIVLVDEFASNELNNKHKEILNRSKLKELHGCEFKNNRNQITAYRDFLNSIYKIGRRANYFMALFILYPKDKYQKEKRDVASLLDEVKKGLAQEQKDIEIRTADSLNEVLEFFLPPIRLTLKEITCSKNSPSLVFFLDKSKDITIKMHEKSFVNDVLQPNIIWVEWIINLALKIQSDRRAQCKIDSKLIKAVDSINSHIVQTADVLGNFSFNFIRHVLKGKPRDNSTRAMKYSLLKTTLLKDEDNASMEANLKKSMHIDANDIVKAKGERDISFLKITHFI